ncbi:MAG TPA: hypothetical protein VKW04_02535 [Planctomycetota bacterium]|nr:hypothetical protein [Planctomycetota bacterium]
MRTKEQPNESAHPIRGGDSPATRSPEDLFAVMTETVATMVSRDLDHAGKTGGSTMESITDTAEQAFHGALDVGGDVGLAAKGVLVGVVRGSRVTGDAALQMADRVCRTLIRRTASAGAEVGLAATGLVQGALVAAKDLGLDSATAASVTAHAAGEAAEEFGADVVREVRVSLAGTIDGLNVLIKEPLQKRSP